MRSDVSMRAYVTISGSLCFYPISLIELIHSKINILSLFHTHVLTNPDAIIFCVGFEQHEGDLVMTEYSFLNE